MRYLITIGIILFFGTVKLMGQSDFRDGFIINNNNDTIFGLLDYRGEKANAKECIFRVNINSENQTFTPEEIKAYRFANSKYYISKLVNFENETKYLFLEYLINGIVDIYCYRDNIGDHYFVDNGTNNLYELKNDKKEIVRNNIYYVKESKEYIGLLKVFFNESSTISKKVEHIGLTHKSLINIAHEYHNEVCNDGECVIYEKKIPITKRTFGIVAGLNGISFSQTKELTDEYYHLRSAQFGFDIFPSIGLYYKVNLSFINERLYLQYEGVYSRVSRKASYSYLGALYDEIVSNDIDLTLNTLNNLGILKYEFPTGKIKPTFQIGGFVNYFFKTDYTQNFKVKYFWKDTYYTGQINESPFEKFDYGINIGAGLKRTYLNSKEIFLDIRYQRGFGLLHGLNTNTFLINIGFQIGK